MYYDASLEDNKMQSLKAYTNNILLIVLYSAEITCFNTRMLNKDLFVDLKEQRLLCVINVWWIS